MTWELEGKDVVGNILREAGSLLLIAKMAYTMDEDDAIALARRLRWLPDEIGQELVDELKLAA